MPRYTGPVRRGALGNNSCFLGNVSQRSFFGGQHLNGVGSLQEDLGPYDYSLGKMSNFGAQNLNGVGATMLSNNEKTLVTIGVIGIVGWFFFGDKIKKGFKKNPGGSRKRKTAILWK